MNFGYWDDECKTLTDANKNLCDFIINQTNIKDNKILDIGCGYGEQDFYWNDKYNYNIVALDISKKQIDYATEKATKINNDSIKFIQGSATNLTFPDKSFKNIICLESAFHYNPRNEFFKECYRVLDNNSELIIADIVLKNYNYGIFKSLFIKFFKDILSVPNENFIIEDNYVKNLKDCGFDVETINITNKTFKPYFIYISKYNNFSFKNNNFSFIFYKKFIDIIINYIEYIPFEYYIFKCKKI